MTTKIEKENTKAVILLDGRLDTPSAATVEKEVQAVMDGTISETLVDCTNLSYISSSGLRILITLNKHFMKMGGKLTLKGLLPEIKEVFDMTGFSSIFDIVD